MRAVANLFIARSRAAIFWFLVTCASVVGSAWYIQDVIADVRTKPQFVMAGTESLYYRAPDLKTFDITSMHADQTILAMETIYNRGPAGLDHQNRRFKLFTKEANQKITEQVIMPQVLLFADNQMRQKVELDSPVVNPMPGQSNATTVATGQVLRTGIAGGKVVNEAWNVKVFFTWTLNPSLDDRSMYPSICKDITFFKMEKTFP
jgi:hypothetical protein